MQENLFLLRKHSVYDDELSVTKMLVESALQLCCVELALISVQFASNEFELLVMDRMKQLVSQRE